MTILSRAAIAEQARRAALDVAKGAKGYQVRNPYPPETEAAQVWDVAFKRYSREAEDAEASA